MKKLILTIIFTLVSLFSFAQTLQTNIIVMREDSIENQLNGTFQYTITQVEDTIKITSKLDTNEYVIFKFEPDLWAAYELGDETKIIVSVIKYCTISYKNTDSYLKKIFDLSKNKETKIGMQVRPPKRKIKVTKEVNDGFESILIEETYEGVTEYISFKIFNYSEEIALREY